MFDFEDFAYEAAYGDGDASTVLLCESSYSAFDQGPALREISKQELARHNTPEDCWVALHGKVYDLTEFARGHVGGAELITKLAGTDGTIPFARKHGENVLNGLASSCCIGEYHGPLPQDFPEKTSSEAAGNTTASKAPSQAAYAADDVHFPPGKKPKTAHHRGGSPGKSTVRAIVVGGGLAGMSAANTVVERGGRVVVFEKAAFCGGNSTKASSGINGADTRSQRMQGIADDVDVFESDTLKGGAKRPEIVKVLCRQSGDAIDWLAGVFSIDLSTVARLGGHSRPRTHRGKERFPGMTITYALIQSIEKIAEKCDLAEIVTKTRVNRLLIDSNGTCVGCRYWREGSEGEVNGPVILTTGGYAADFGHDSLLSMYRPDLLHLPTTNSEQSTGDGIKMAQLVGARTLDLEWVQVHPTGLVAPSDPDAKTKFLAAEALRGAGGLIIDAEGKRFVNELGRRDDTTREMWKNKPPFRLLLNSAASEEVIWHCKHYVSRGVMRFYESGQELANDVGVPLSVLEDVHEIHYQSSKKTDKDPHGGPWVGYPSGKSWDEPSGLTGAGKCFFHNVIKGSQVKTEPFYVAIITPVLHYCMGGLETDVNAAVLGSQGTAIPGLWAAGEVAGGVHGNNRLGGNSLLDCIVFGRISGDACVKHMHGTDMKPRSLHELWGISPQMLDMPAAEMKQFTLEEVSQHKTEKDCWIIVHDRVLDLTKFLKDHPGGALPILAFAGKDATTEFDMVHPPGVIEKYASGAVIGTVSRPESGVLDVSKSAVSFGGNMHRSEEALPSPIWCPCCRGALLTASAHCETCNIEVIIKRKAPDGDAT